MHFFCYCYENYGLNKNVIFVRQFLAEESFKLLIITPSRQLHHYRIPNFQVIEIGIKGYNRPSCSHGMTYMWKYFVLM